MPRLTKQEWSLVREALETLTMDPPGSWPDDPEVEEKLAAFRKLRGKLVATGKEA